MDNQHSDEQVQPLAPPVIVPAGWLARARIQSIELAEARARRARSFRPEVVRQERSSGVFVRHPLAMVMASALLLVLVASGAWALMARGKRVTEKTPRAANETETRSTTPRVPRSVSPVVATPAPARPPASPPSSPPPPTARARRKEASRERPVVPPAAAEPLQRPDGELILVPSHEKQPPLFSPEEWKQQRSQPRD